MAQVSIFSPWKDASQNRGGEDLSRLMYVKCIGDTDIAGAQITASTLTVAAAVDTLTFTTNAAGDTDINSYTGAAGAAGTITTSDANANTLGEVINIINGVGLGQNANTRYRAALADYPPTLALVASDFAALGATNILRGRNDVGLGVLADTSTAGKIAADDLWVGIGTAGGCIEGSGWQYPDYFEDIPGSSTTASVNTRIRRSGPGVGRKDHDTITRKKQYRITGFSSQSLLATTYNFAVYDINGTQIYNEPLTAAAVTLFQDRSNTPIVGPVGSPLFCRFWGTGANTDGSISVMAEERVA
jgi:hypothetical protein